MPLRPEDRLQSRCRMYLKDALPAPGYWSSVDHARKQSLRSGQIQKARGIKRGLPDIMIWYRGAFIGVELKAGRGDTSEMQDIVGAALEANGFVYSVVRSVEGLHATLERAGVPVLPSMRIAAMHHDAALAEAAYAPKKPPSKPRKAMAQKPNQRGLAKLAKLRAGGLFA